MQLVYAHEEPVWPDNRSIFLAGPSPRGNGEYNWRNEAWIILSRLGFTGIVYLPLPRDGKYLPDYDHVAQMDWELKHLEAAGVIAFWIPRDLNTLPGFTTNVEFGRFSRSGRAILGYPEGAPKMKYLRHIAQIDGVPVYHLLEETLAIAMQRLS